MDDVISKVQVDYVSTGADKVAADYDRVAQAQARLAQGSAGANVVNDSVSRSTLSAQRALESYTRAHDPLSRAMADLARGERLASAARAQGVEATDAHSRALDNARKRVQELKDEVEKHTKSLGLNRNQTMELTHVAKSFVDQIAAGASPMRALEIEGGRIAQVFAEGKGGVTGTFRALGSMIGGLLTPTVVLTGAVAGLTVAGVAAFMAYESGQDKLATALDGIGRRSGATIAQLNAVAEAGARIGHLTASQATGLAADYTKVGFTTDTTSSLIGSTKAYAKATGTDVDAAAKSLAQAFAAPVQGASDLDKQLGFLDGKLKTTIEDLEAQGRVDDARRVLADALNKSLAQTTDVTWGFMHEMEDAKNWIADVFVRAGHGIESTVFGGTMQQQLQFYKDQLPYTTSWAPGNFNTDNVQRRIADLEKRIAAEADAPARAAAAKREADANDLSQRADTIVRAVLPDIVRAQTTANNLVVLQQALNDPVVLSKLGVTVGQASRAFGNLAVQQANADPLKTMAEDSKLAVQAIEAFTLAERVAVEARRAEIAVLRESGDVRKAALAAEIARNEEIAKANNAAEDRLAQAQQDRALVGLSPYARGRQEIVNQYEGTNGLFAKDGATSTELRNAMKPVAADLDAAADLIAAALRRGAASITAATNPFGTIPVMRGANDNGALGRAPASVFPMISDAADRTGIDPAVIAAIGERENGFRLSGATGILGPNGRPASTAWGYGQLTDGAARDVAQAVPGFDKYNPSTAVFGSAEYLSILQRRNGGDLTAALNAYGGTPGYASDIMRRAGTPLTVGAGATVAPIASTALTSDRRAMNTQLAGYDEEQYAGPLKAANQALDNQIALLDRQKATLGLSASQIEGAAAAQKLLNQYINEGVPITDKLRGEIEAYGARAAAAAKDAADFQAQQQRLIASMDLMRSTARDALGTFVDDLIKGKGAGQAFADVLQQIMQKALAMAEDQLIQACSARPPRPRAACSVRSSVRSSASATTRPAPTTGAAARHGSASVVRRSSTCRPMRKSCRTAWRPIPRPPTATRGTVGRTSFTSTSRRPRPRPSRPRKARSRRCCPVPSRTASGTPDVAGFHEIRFPITISRDSKAGVQRQTDVVALRSGAEERNSLWALGRRKYNAGYGTKTLADLQAVVQFFEARRGRFFGFRWKDYLDHASSPPGVAPSALDQSIGTGTGTTFGFQLVKLYGDSFDPFARAITKPVSGTVLVAVAGVQKTYGADYAVDTTTGMVTFGTAPASGAPVTAGFQFDVPVRFDTDYLEVNLSSIGYGEAPNIPIIEIRT